MARIRSVKPELRTDLTVAQWPIEVRYFWVLLWGYLDDEGRGVDDPRLVKADCFPLDDGLSRDTLLDWLAILEGTVCRYQVDGRRYLHAVKWHKHQKPQHPRPSTLPPCPEHEPEKFTEWRSSNPEKPLPMSGEASPDDPGSSGEAYTLSSRGVVVEKETAESPPPEPPPRVDVERLCSRLVERMVGNGCREPAVTAKWRDAARLLLDRDGVPLDEALAVLDWSQDSSFWKANIHSLPTFREKFDRLRQQASNDPNFGTRSVSPRDEWMYQ